MENSRRPSSVTHAKCICNPFRLCHHKTKHPNRRDMLEPSICRHHPLSLRLALWIVPEHLPSLQCAIFWTTRSGCRLVSDTYLSMERTNMNFHGEMYFKCFSTYPRMSSIPCRDNWREQKNNRIFGATSKDGNMSVHLPQTIEAFLAARTILQITFTALRQHTFGYHRCADLFVACVWELSANDEQKHCWYGYTQRGRKVFHFLFLFFVYLI